MNGDFLQREQIVDCRLSLAKGEGRVRVRCCKGEEYPTPHLDPLPVTKGRGGNVVVG